MPQTLTAVSVFLASPSDVSAERSFVTASIEAWNARHSRASGVAFQLIKWETSVSAGFGEDGQQVINSQVNDDYDVLVAIFWTKLGTVTPRATSGTVEEYRRAWSRFQRGEAVEIAFFFKDAAIDFKKTDLTQLSLVNDFEKEVQQAGALTKTFRDQEGLNLEIGILLDRLARNLAPSAVSSDKSKGSSRQVVTLKKGKIVAIDNDAGLFDIVDDLNEHAESGGKFLDSLSANLGDMTSITASVTQELDEIKAVRSLEPADTKPGLNRIADSMDFFSEFIEADMMEYSENLNALANNVRDIIRISYDWIDSDEDMLSSLAPFRQVLLQIHSAISSSQVALDGMVGNVDGLPRAMTRFNKSKRRLSHNITGLIGVNQSGKALIEQALYELGMLIVAVETKVSDEIV